MTNIFKNITSFIVNSFRPEEVEVTVTKVGGRTVYSFSKVSGK